MNSLRIADIVRAEVKKLPASSCPISNDGPSRAQDDDADYAVEWEIDIQPVPASACPIGIWFTNNGHISMGFDNWQRLSDRIGVSSTNSRFVFGFEPRALEEAQILSVLSVVFTGNVEARYIELFGRLLYASGRVLSSVGIPQLQRTNWGKSICTICNLTGYWKREKMTAAEFLRYVARE